MCRRPLLPLLALAALLTLLPAGHALSCFQCTGTPFLRSGANPAGFNSSGVAMLHTSEGSKRFPDISCDSFDPSLDKYKMTCPPGYNKACAKNVLDGETFERGCANLAGDQCTDFGHDVSQCLCMDDFCNSAGLATPALLLLLPAALLAALSGRQ